MHLNHSQLYAYLEDQLTLLERRQFQKHLAICPRCEERLRNLSRAEQDVKTQFGQWKMSLRLTRDFQAVLADAQKPMSLSVNGTGIALGLVCALMMLMPLLSRANAEDFSTHPELINLPATLDGFEEADQPVTPDALALVFWQGSFSTPIPMQFASPAPLPQATAIASYEPKN